MLRRHPLPSVRDMKKRLILLALGAFFVPASIVAGCGGVPGNAVAEVDGNAIEKSSFDHWLTVASRSGGQASAAAPKPPKFTECIKQKRKTTPKPAKGQPKVTDGQLKSQCKQEYNALRDQVLQLLVSFEWIEGEAKAQNIKVSDKEIQKTFDKQKKERFAQPERRDLRIVLTKGEAKAKQAKKALDGGQSFKAVAKKFSIDQASKAQGGKLPAVAKGQQEKALDTAIFKAGKGELTGPVKTQFGYYVFEVTKITKASQQSLEQAKPTIKQTLASQNQQKALDKFVKSFRKRWKAKTECAAGYRTQDCKNAPKATPTPSATPPAGTAPAPAQPTATPEGN